MYTVAETGNGQEIDGYKLADIAVICPACNLVFCTSCLVETPPLSEHDVYEADLHRVFPHPSLRSALVTVCPSCYFAGWTHLFPPSNLRPETLMPAALAHDTKKFALAISSARKQLWHGLDLAYLALNGCWLAREARELSKPWLELAALEHEKAGAETFYDDGYWHLVVGEIYRQLGQFSAALAAYKSISAASPIPYELIKLSLERVAAGDSQVAVLPSHLVKLILASN